MLVLLAQSDTRELTLSVLSDAFWQVSVFVAATLAVYHLVANSVLKSNRLAKVKSLPAGQVLFASLLGAIPGCGGAIIVITQYVSGSMSFGAVVAVLTATMGDAAFLLLASEPVTGLGVIALTMTIGVISGLIVDKIHDKNFLRPKDTEQTKQKKCRACKSVKESNDIPAVMKLQGKLWRLLIVPGAIIGLMFAGQVDFEQFFAGSELVIQILGAVLAICFITLWASTTEISSFETFVSEDKKRDDSLTFQKVALDTNFVTSWVVLAFISFELLMHFKPI